MGLLEVKHPFTPYHTLIKRDLGKIYIRDYAPLYIWIQLMFFRDYFRLKEDRDCMNKRNFEARLPTDCCCGKTLSVIYSECVCVCVCVCGFVYLACNLHAP